MFPVLIVTLHRNQVYSNGTTKNLSVDLQYLPSISINLFVSFSFSLYFKTVFFLFPLLNLFCTVSIEHSKDPKVYISTAAFWVVLNYFFLTKFPLHLCLHFSLLLHYNFLYLHYETFQRHKEMFSMMSSLLKEQTHYF